MQKKVAVRVGPPPSAQAQAANQRATTQKPNTKQLKGEKEAEARAKRGWVHIHTYKEKKSSSSAIQTYAELPLPPPPPLPQPMLLTADCWLLS